MKKCLLIFFENFLEIFVTNQKIRHIYWEVEIMEENMRSLERKLNQIIDDELKKNIPQIDTELIMACCDGLLRIDDIKRYTVTESEVKDSIAIICKKPKEIIGFMRPLRILLIAAIILVMLAIGSIGYAQYKYNIFNFSDHSTVLFEQSDSKMVDNFKLGFIPSGFALSFESDNKYEHSKEYVKGKDSFTVTKKACNEGININTEYKDCKITQINGIDYIEYGETRHGYGIIWEKNGYQYTVSGNISSQVLKEIAWHIGEN